MARRLAGSLLAQRQTGRLRARGRPSRAAGAAPLGFVLALALPLPLAAGAQQAGTGTSSASVPAGDSLALPRATVVAPLAGGARTERAELVEVDTAAAADTPLSLRSINAGDLQRFGARSLSDAVRFDAGVGDAYNTVGYIESLQIRGFLLSDILNYRRNGLPVSNHAILALENVDRFELLKGVSGVLAGSSTPGGLVNVVTRRPPDGDVREITLALSERGTRGIRGELGGRFGADDAFGYRVGVAHEDRRPYARGADGRRVLATAAMDWRRADGARLDAEIESHDLRQVSVPGYGLLDVDGNGVGETVPSPTLAAFDPRNNLNTQPWSQPFTSHALVGSVRWQQPVAPGWLWGLRAGLQRIDTDDRIAFPDGCSAAPAYVYPGLCGDGSVDIYDFRSLDERRRLWAADTFVEGRLDALGVQHGLRVGLRTTRYRERLPAAQAYNYAGTVSVFAPVPLPAAPDPLTVNTQRDLRVTEAYAFDAVRLGERWSTWLGIRATRLQAASAKTDGSEPVALSQGFVTPWLALGLRPWADALAYASAGSGVETESVPNRPLQFSNAGAALPAARSRQVEVGLKQGIGRDSLATVALFSARRPLSDYDRAAAGPTPAVAGGRVVRHRGLEIAADLRLSPHWRVDANASWTLATTLRAIDTARVGWRAPNVPRVAGSLTATWKPGFAGGWSLSNRLTAAGSRAVDADVPVRLPGYAQWDLALRLDTQAGGVPLRWLAGVDNVLDRRYWREAPTQYWGGVYLFPAAPRRFHVAVTASI